MYTTKLKTRHIFHKFTLDLGSSPQQIKSNFRNKKIKKKIKQVSNIQIHGVDFVCVNLSPSTSFRIRELCQTHKS